MYQDCVELKSLSAHRANTGAAGSSPWRGALARLVRLRRLAASSRGPVARRPGRVRRQHAAQAPGTWQAV